MLLEKYLRSLFNKHIRHLFIKSNCELCNSEINLQLHHVKSFKELQKETLDQLNLQINNTKEYTKIEMLNIKNVFLGKHLLINYYTLCHSCHTEHHKDLSSVARELTNKLKLTRQLKYIEDTVLPYLKSNTNKKIMSEDKNILINILNLRDERGRDLKGINSINNFLGEYNINYKLVSKRTSKRINGVVVPYKYWVIKESQ